MRPTIFRHGWNLETPDTEILSQDFHFGEAKGIDEDGEETDKRVFKIPSWLKR